MIDLKAMPFCLNDSEAKWVNDTLSRMTDDEKIGQLFIPCMTVNKAYTDEDAFKDENAVLKLNIGGVLYRRAPAREILMRHNYLNSRSRIPLLTAANLETGGIGIADEGTFAARQMQIAATSQPEKYAYKLGQICGTEGAAVGCNLSFAPVCDIDLNWRNPITNVRTYGSNPLTVECCALEYLRGCTESGVMCTAKHFPGDGVDETDQHILTSVNSLSRNKWEESYGKIYKAMINAGVMSVMIGHIAQPALNDEFGGNDKTRFLPASLSKPIVTGVLREHLGFNGLIITDSTCMLGFLCAMERRLAVPQAIMAGCDMFLFNKNLCEDLEFMKRGLNEGLLTRERLDEAVCRILAAKAAMRLNKPCVQSKNDLSVLRCSEHIKTAVSCADDSVTLVRDEQAMLPLNPAKHRRILQHCQGNNSNIDKLSDTIARLLTENGFSVSVYKNGSEGDFSVKEFKQSYDAVLLLADIENASNKVTNRLNWSYPGGNGNGAPWFTNEIPTAFISFANPYHIVDVPMMKTFINCYCGSEYIPGVLVNKLLGKSAFKGHSPIDPYLGKQWLKSHI